MCSVEATRPPTFTCAWGPKRTPFGLSRKTVPVALSMPLMRLGLASKIRLSARPPTGWTKLVTSLGAMLNCDQ
jgi:hypothetical protein